jgi:hypothetical protein
MKYSITFSSKIQIIMKMKIKILLYIIQPATCQYMKLATGIINATSNIIVMELRVM